MRRRAIIATALALLLAIPAAASITVTGQADIALARVSQNEVRLGTRITNTAPYEICVSRVTTRAFFQNGRRADVVFAGLDSVGDFTMAPGQSFQVGSTARLLTYEQVRVRLEASAGSGSAAINLTRLRRDMSRGRYYFELAFTYTPCGDPGGGWVGQPPEITVTLGRSNTIRLP